MDRWHLKLFVHDVPLDASAFCTSSWQSFFDEKKLMLDDHNVLLGLQEGDGLINGQASPNSAMSISPATSEVCSILDPNEKNHQNSNRQSTTLNNASNLKQRNNKSSRGSSRQVSSPQQNVDRSDLDLDWRSSSNTTSNTTSSTTSTSTPNTTTTQRQLSADEDTNWRDHKPLNEDRGDNSWRTIKSKNRKIQGRIFHIAAFEFWLGMVNLFAGNSKFEEKTTQHQHGDSKNDNQVGKSVVQVLDNDKSVSVATSSSVATTTASRVSNNQVDPCISILDNDKEAVKNKRKNKKKTNKKQKPQNNANSTMTSELSSTSSKDTSVESDHHNNSEHSSKCSQAQVSRLPGQIKPKRWQKWNWRGHTVPTSAASKLSTAASSSKA